VSVCTRADFDASALAPLVGADGRDDGAPHAYAHLNADAFAVVERHLVAKALSEFAHERLITPVRVSEAAGAASADGADHGPTSASAGDGTWERAVAGSTRYTFAARLLPLEHWVSDEDSITRRRDGAEAALDVQELVVELQEDLALPEDLISPYREELASTM